MSMRMGRCRLGLRGRRIPSIVGLSTMALIDRLERRMGWIAIPGLVRIIMCFQLLVFVLVQLQRATNDGYPAIVELLYLDRERILDGEVWRVVSFVFLPPTLHQFILMLFAFMFTFFLGELLEAMWGSFRTTLYVLGGILGMVIGEFIFHGFGIYLLGLAGGGWGRLLLMATLLFAVAVYEPKREILLFGIIPIKMFWLALFEGGILLIDVLRGPPGLSLAIIIGISNFLIVFIPGFRRSMKMRVETGARRRKFEAAQLPVSEAFHTCSSCGKTENDDADLVFRVAASGDEYCSDCRTES